MGSDALFQSPQPRFHALLEGFLQDRSELSRYGCFNGFWILETGSFDDFLEFGKQKEVKGGQIWRVGWLLQYSSVIFGKKLPNSQGIMSWSIVTMKQPWPRFPQLSSFLPHWAHQTSQAVFVDVLINSLALWQELCLDNTIDIKKSDQHHLGFGLKHPRLLGSWWQCAFPFNALPFGEWIVLEDPWHIPSNNSFQQVGFSFELLQNVSTHLHLPLLLSFIQQPWYHFCTDLPHPQIFRNDPPYPLTLHTQLICYHSNSKMAITPHHLSHTLNIFICSACGWPPTPVIIFHLLSSPFEPPMPLKKTSSWHRVITINFLKQL